MRVTAGIVGKSSTPLVDERHEGNEHGKKQRKICKKLSIGHDSHSKKLSCLLSSAVLDGLFGNLEPDESVICD
jgi:hypothetical protein